MQYVAPILFVITVIVWLLFAIRSRRLNDLQRTISQLPEQDRIRAIQTELGKATSGKSAKDWIAQQKKLRFYAQIGISVVLLIAALYIILSTSFSPSEKHWLMGRSVRSSDFG